MTKTKKSDRSEQQINALKQKITELESGWQRTQADFENYRKRIESLKAEWIASANADLILKILPVLDHFQRATLHLPQDLKGQEWVKGIQLIEKNLGDILAQEGVAKIETKPGDIFDHNLHEAISYEDNDQFKENQIIAIIEEGYKLGDRVLRAVKVRVSKGK